MTRTQTQIAPAKASTPEIKGRESLLGAYRTEIAIALAIVLLALAVGSQVPQALTWGNFANITQAGAPLIIIRLAFFLWS